MLICPLRVLEEEREEAAGWSPALSPALPAGLLLRLLEPRFTRSQTRGLAVAGKSQLGAGGEAWLLCCCSFIFELERTIFRSS